MGKTAWIVIHFVGSATKYSSYIIAIIVQQNREKCLTFPLLAPVAPIYSTVISCDCGILCGFGYHWILRMLGLWWSSPYSAKPGFHLSWSCWVSPPQKLSDLHDCEITFQVNVHEVSWRWNRTFWQKPSLGRLFDLAIDKQTENGQETPRKHLRGRKVL